MRKQKQKMPKIIRQWITALRSGKYKQGKGGLKTDDKCCCLGVLCDLALKKGVISEIKGSYLPNEVVKWVGLTSVDPMIRVNSSTYNALANLNDGHMCQRKSFKQIATLIERGYERILESK